MSLREFLTSLFEHGRVRVGPPRGDLQKEELLPADGVLAACEQHIRAEFPGVAPPLDLAAARWAAVMFYRACQLAAHREQSVEKVLSAAVPCASSDSLAATAPASLHYSVDVVFRFLPDLERLARGVSQEDPLLAPVRQWASDWPLSSVGMKGVTPKDVDVIIEHPGLLRYYADRVVARRDPTRLSHPRVAATVRQALGMYQLLPAEMAAALESSA